jgi:hypothetical protein
MDDILLVSSPNVCSKPFGWLKLNVWLKSWLTLSHLGSEKQYRIFAKMSSTQTQSQNCANYKEISFHEEQDTAVEKHPSIGCGASA